MLIKSIILKIGDFGVEKELKVVVFTNKGKAKNERAPDFIIYEDRPRENLETPKASSASSESNDDVPAGF